MTVCVSSFTERSKAIVAVADKAVTLGASAPIQTDTGIKKMLPVGNSGWYALVAGSPSFATAVIEKTKFLMVQDRYRDCKLSATAMMLCMRDAYKQCREDLTETAILSPYLLTKDTWASRPTTMHPLNAKVSDAVQDKLEEFSAKTSLLVFGFSRDGARAKPHLFSVIDPGVGLNHDLTGSHAVGIGRLAAIGQMAFWEVDRNDPLDRSLYEVFHAKATAELVQGVGFSWDAWVAFPNMIPINVNENIRKLLDRAFSYQAASPYEKDKFGKREAPPKNWQKKVKKYTDGLLARFKQHEKSTSQKSKGRR